MAESLRDLIARCPPRRSSPVQFSDTEGLSPSTPEKEDLVLRTPSPTPSQAFDLGSPPPLELPPAVSRPNPTKPRHPNLKTSLAPRIPLSAPAPPSSSAKPNLKERIAAHEAFLRHKEAAYDRIAKQRRTLPIFVPVQTRIDRTVSSRTRSRTKIRKYLDCGPCGIVWPGKKQYKQHLSSRRHRRIVEGEKRLPCTLCDKVLFSREDYDRHIQGRKHKMAQIASKLSN